jgi:hypothetical protein
VRLEAPEQRDATDVEALRLARLLLAQAGG